MQSEPEDEQLKSSMVDGVNPVEITSGLAAKETFIKCEFCSFFFNFIESYITLGTFHFPLHADSESITRRSE